MGRKAKVLLTAALVAAAALLASEPLLAAKRGAPVLPPLTSPATNVRQAGRVVWHDLLTPDLAVDERFYGALFGWTYRDMHSGRHTYVVAFADGVPVAGLLERPLPRDGGRRPQWLGFISTDDVDAAMHAALEHGARDVSKPHDYPQRGRQAVLQDPQGVAFGMISSTTGDPPDWLAEPGQWIWSALFTHDAENEAAFYQDVFGYDVYDLDDSSDDATTGSGAVVHLELASHDYARASINSLPDAQARRSRWVQFVRVESAWSAAAKAQALGARVVLAPRVDRQGGHIALLADPSGALFGVMDWPDSDEGSAAGPAPPSVGPHGGPP
ncbi:MAG TPA: VOC family protein [Steroidobacteraceae bacterium]|nr:VOC family protein [Steroidobacteraceae bacterium]